jgi:hypothetical protein
VIIAPPGTLNGIKVNIMSCFILSDKHFSAIAHRVYPSDIQGFANRLKRINITSVNFRYKENTRFAPVKLTPIDSDLTDNDIGKLIACWDYQSCACWDYQSCEDNSIDYQLMKTYLYAFKLPDNGRYWTI